MSSRIAKIVEREGAAILNLRGMNHDSLYAAKEDAAHLIQAVDPTDRKKYAAWIMGLWKRGEVQKEDLASGANSDLYDIISKFERHKHRLVGDDFNKRSVMTHKTKESMEDCVTPFERAELSAMSGKERKRIESYRAGLHTVEFTMPSGLHVALSQSPLAARFNGMGTRWCTSALQNTDEFSAYMTEGGLFVFTLPCGEKFQGHLPVYADSGYEIGEFTLLNARDALPNEEERALLAPFAKDIADVCASVVIDSDGELLNVRTENVVLHCDHSAHIVWEKMQDIIAGKATLDKNENQPQTPNCLSQEEIEHARWSEPFQAIFLPEDDDGNTVTLNCDALTEDVLMRGIADHTSPLMAICDKEAGRVRHVQGDLIGLIHRAVALQTKASPDSSHHRFGVFAVGRPAFLRSDAPLAKIIATQARALPLEEKIALLKSDPNALLLMSDVWTKSDMKDIRAAAPREFDAMVVEVVCAAIGDYAEGKRSGRPENAFGLLETAIPLMGDDGAILGDALLTDSLRRSVGRTAQRDKIAHSYRAYCVSLATGCDRDVIQSYIGLDAKTIKMSDHVAGIFPLVSKTDAGAVYLSFSNSVLRMSYDVGYKRMDTLTLTCRAVPEISALKDKFGRPDEYFMLSALVNKEGQDALDVSDAELMALLDTQLETLNRARTSLGVEPVTREEVESGIVHTQGHAPTGKAMPSIAQICRKHGLSIKQFLSPPTINEESKRLIETFKTIGGAEYKERLVETLHQRVERARHDINAAKAVVARFNDDKKKVMTHRVSEPSL